MEKKSKKKVDEIRAEMQCEKNFTCLENNYKSLCKARDMGLEGYVECIDDGVLGCHFSLPFGNSYFCRCPLRVHLVKHADRDVNGHE